MAYLKYFYGFMKHLSHSKEKHYHKHYDKSQLIAELFPRNKSNHNKLNNKADHRPKKLSSDKLIENISTPKPCGGGSSGRPFLVHNAVFVDLEFGSNRNGRPNDANRPFRTIERAIEDVLKFNPSENNILVVNVSPGSYNEDVATPAGVNLSGWPAATQIKSLTVNGTNNVKILTINSVNKTAITINAGTPRFQFVDAKSNCTTGLAGQPVLNAVGNGAEFTDCHINMVSGTGNPIGISDAAAMVDVIAIHNESLLTFTNTDCTVTTIGDVGSVVLYDTLQRMSDLYQSSPRQPTRVVTTGLNISGGTSRMAIGGRARELVVWDTMGTPSDIGSNLPAQVTPPPVSMISANRIMVKAPVAPASLIGDTGDLRVLVANSSVQFNRSPTVGLTDALATGIIPGLAAPIVQVSSTTFSDMTLPPVQGIFNSIIFNAADSDGSLRSTGALYNNVTEISSNYTLTSKDNTVRTTAPNITLVLTAPSTIAPGNTSHGNLKIIRKDAAGSMLVTGPIGPTSGTGPSVNENSK